MSDNPARTCPKCATAIPASFPEGLCPKCLLEQAAPDAPPAEGTPAPKLAEPEAAENTVPVPPPVSSGTPARQTGVPSLDLLRGLFPELEILSVLGAGGMGAVYKARQPRLHRLVALKIMVCPPGHEAAFALRFEREAQVLARLNHPHIVILYDFGEIPAERTGADPLYYFLMEHVDGTDLGQLIKSKELKPAQALAIVPQICEALQYAHDQGITHRDIKPPNILIDKRGTVKIADFGLAKMVAGPEETLMTGLTQTGTAMGTPHYMAPEQWEHPDQVDHRADIYALGVVLYEMLTGERPAGVFEPPSKKTKPPVDKKLDSVVMRAMDKNPDRRYQQAGQIGDDVTRISGMNKSRPASAKGTPEPKRGLLKPLLALGAAAALGIGGWILWQGEPPAAVTSKTVPGGPSVQPKAPAPHQAAWVPMYRQAAELAPLFGKPKALYPFLSDPTLAQDPATGLELSDGWLTPTTTQVKLPLPSARNAGVRLKVKMSDPDKMDGASIWLRSVDGGAVYSGGWRGIIHNFGKSSKEPEYLAARKNLVAKKLGETFTLEFYTIGQDLICRYDGEVIRVREPGDDPAIGTVNHLMIRNPVTDIEFINLDGLSEAQALKLAGLGVAEDTAVTGTAKPGRLRAAGTMSNGKPPALEKFAAYDDFVDVVASRDYCMALRANGETVSSDGKADFQGIARIARSFQNYHCFIEKAGGLRFRPEREMALPASLKGRVIMDAACGIHHGVTLLEGGLAVVFGKRYEEAVEDVNEAGGTGTPRWPQPEAAALQNVKGVAVTYTHAATLHHDGTVSVWGWEGPVKWQPEPEMKPVRQISSFHDALHLLDEAGQVWSLPLPRSAHPQQPVSFNGHAKLLGKDAVLLRDNLWLDAEGAWQATAADLPTVETLKSAPLKPETSFAQMASPTGPQPFGYVLWIEPKLQAAVKGRLRGSGFHLDGSPLDLKNAEGITDFVQVILTDRGWVGLRANGTQVTDVGGHGDKNIVRLLPSWFNSYGTINRDGRLGIERQASVEVKAIPEDVQRIGVVDACWDGGQAIALLKDGSARVWGEHYTRDHEGPKWPAPPAEALQNVRKIAISHWRAATLRHDGKWHIWGGHGGSSGPFDLQPFEKWGEIADIETGYGLLRVLTRSGEVYNLSGSRPLTGGLVTNDVAAICDQLLWSKGASVWTWNDPNRPGAQPEVDALLKQIGNRPREAWDLRIVGEPNASKVAGVWIEPVEAKPATPAPNQR